jgi:hypothetical protein
VKAIFGWLAAAVVLGLARLLRKQGRPLSASEMKLLTPIFEHAVDLRQVRVVDELSGILNVSGRAYVIENTIFVPHESTPLPERVLVHEVCHVWQFQAFGYHYIGDSVVAQTWGEGYDFTTALQRATPFAHLNCEQQASFIEWVFCLGAMKDNQVFDSPAVSKMWDEARAMLSHR